jgi:hypothetical protein
MIKIRKKVAWMYGETDIEREKWKERNEKNCNN